VVVLAGVPREKGAKPRKSSTTERESKWKNSNTGQKRVVLGGEPLRRKKREKLETETTRNGPNLKETVLR